MHYLFESGTSGIYALSVDVTGANIERLEAFPWLLRKAIDVRQLHLHFAEAVPTLHAKGYCLLDTHEAIRVA
jgi:hypothetical protein